MIPLVKAVISLDDRLVAAQLEKNPDLFSQDDAPTDILHTMLTSTMSPLLAPGRRTVVYILRNYGLDINTQNENGDTPLHLLLQGHADTELCEALLQCGADIYLRNNAGLTAADLLSLPNVPDITRELVLKYTPGLWRAIEDDDLMNVRKLINLWCRVDVQKNGRSLKDLALNKGTEHIIRLILDITSSMKLAHCALAGDTTGARKVLNNKEKVNVDFKNLGDMGATPLFYAIMHNNYALVELLRSHGAKMDTTITFEDNDIPLYFTSLNKDIDPEIIKCLTPSPTNAPNFCRLHYKGRTVLHYCIENQIAPSVVRHILNLGYPELLSQRTQTGHSLRDLAEHYDRGEYVKVIDEVVHDWYLDNNSHHRQLLALYGYPYLRSAQKDGTEGAEVIQSMETSSQQAKFDSELADYQDQIERLHEAVEAGNLQDVKTLLFYTSPNKDCFISCLANSRNKTDGQPLLHKAVLRQHTQIVELLAKTLTSTSKVKLDEVIDSRLRTALHYAYGIPTAKEITYILQDHGSSDFTLDKDCRSPLVFRDQRERTEMFCLIQYHISKEFDKEEPWPWQPLRIPLIGAPGHAHNHVKLRQFTGAEASPLGCIEDVCEIPGSAIKSLEGAIGGMGEEDEEDEEEDDDEEEDGEVYEVGENQGKTCTLL